MINKQEIREFLTTLTKNVNVGDDDSLLVTKLLDSMKVAELVVFLEEKYSLSLDADDIVPENLDSVNAIAAFLEGKGIV